VSVHIDRTGAVLVVTLDRPDRRNAVDASTARELSAAFRSFDADPALSVGVLTGAGGNFCTALTSRRLLKAPVQKSAKATARWG
jgi:enoyl-CoA hydratase